MKKKLCYIVTLFVALCCVLTACNGAKPTTARIRWNTEHYEYDITLADISTESSQYFNTYYDGYYKDCNIQTNGMVETKLTAKDEIVPERVSGTLVWDIKTDNVNGICTFYTLQELHCWYKTETLQEFDCYDELSYYTVSTADGLTELKSIVYKTVDFDALPAQKPASSESIFVGFYLGHAHQEVSNYLVRTSYASTKATTTVIELNQNDVDTMYGDATYLSNEITVNGGFDASKIDTTNIKQYNTTQSEIDVAKNRNYIDANQILLYVRSLQKDSDNFADAPTVTVFEPMTCKTYTANFAFNHSAKVYLQVKQPTGAEDDGCICTLLNQVNVALDGNALLCQFNLPDVESLGNFDMLSDDYKYTAVHFRSGYCAYTMNESFFTDDIVGTLAALKK